MSRRSSWLADAGGQQQAERRRAAGTWARRPGRRGAGRRAPATARQTVAAPAVSTGLVRARLGVGLDGLDGRRQPRRPVVVGASVAAALSRRGLEPVLDVVVTHPGEHAEKLVGRQVGGAGEHLAGRREEGGRRPAAHVVAAVDVRVGGRCRRAPARSRSVIAAMHPRVGVARLVHDVAPVAPDRRDREQDRACRSREPRRRRPRPRDRQAIS